MKKKGFTLVELLVVIAILAILATVSIVGYTQFIAKSKGSVALQEAVQVRDMIIAEDINNDYFYVDTTNNKLVYSVENEAKTGSDVSNYFTKSCEAATGEVASGTTYYKDDKGTALASQPTVGTSAASYYTWDEETYKACSSGDKAQSGVTYYENKGTAQAPDYQEKSGLTSASDATYYEWADDKISGQIKTDLGTLYAYISDSDGAGTITYTKDGYTVTINFNGVEMKAVK